MKALRMLAMSGLLAMCAAPGPVSKAQELVPAARSRVDGAGRVRFSGRIVALAARLRPQAEAFAEGLRRLGIEPVEVLARSAGAGRGEITFELGKLPDGLSYEIRARAAAVRVKAEHQVGAAQAAASLLQLARIDDEGASWPSTAIRDGPDCPFRCFMVDMGRNPHSPRTLHHVVDMCGFYKVNLLQLHLADDQLCSWPSRVFPKLVSPRAGWRWEDFVELEAYSQARGVTIIPELDVPAHSTILRRSYPQVFGRTPAELAASPAARRGLERLLAEVSEISRIVVFETAVGKSYEEYRVEVSRDGRNFAQVGAAGRGSRGESDHVAHQFPARRARYVRIVTRGCKNLVFPSFSRLTEVQVFR